MGNKQSVKFVNQSVEKEKFKKLRNNYIDGVSKKQSFELEQIFITLIMKLNYYQARCKVCNIPAIYEVSAFSNSIEKRNIMIPKTINYVSGLIVVNKNDSPAKLKIIWQGKKKKKVIETIKVTENKGEINLSMFTSTFGDWRIETDHNVIVKLKCGLIDGRVADKYNNLFYINTSGKSVSM